MQSRSSLKTVRFCQHPPHAGFYLKKKKIIYKMKWKQNKKKSIPCESELSGGNVYTQVTEWISLRVWNRIDDVQNTKEDCSLSSLMTCAHSQCTMKHSCLMQLTAWNCLAVLPSTVPIINRLKLVLTSCIFITSKSATERFTSHCDYATTTNQSANGKLYVLKRKKNCFLVCWTCFSQFAYNLPSFRL